MYIIPVMLDVHYSSIYFCTLILYSMRHIIPVLPDVHDSYFAWCTLSPIAMFYVILLHANLFYLFCQKSLMYLIPV